MTRHKTNDLRMPSDMTAGSYNKCIGCEFNKPAGWCTKVKGWGYRVSGKCGEPGKTKKK